MDERDLIEKLKKEIADTFDDKLVNSKIVQEKAVKLSKKLASYIDANEISIESGKLLAQTLTEKISEELFENGKMSEEFAKGVIKPSIERNYEIVSGYTKDVQDSLNKKAGINIKSKRAKFNEERADNLCEKLAEKDFEDTKWLLDEPIVNNSQSIVDDTIKVNADFLSKSGLKETISRSTNGGCCEWCEEVSGTFDYEYVKEWVRRDPKHNVFSRHRYCNCIISHTTEKGIKAVNNQWNDNRHKKKKRIELSEAENLDKYSKKYTGASGAKNYFRDESNDYLKDEKKIKEETHAYLMYDEIKNSNQKVEKRKIYNNIAKFEEMKDFSKKDVDIAFDHVFNDIHELDDGKGLFKPDFDMAQSWNRLIKDDNIKDHDLILLKHERLEHDLMYQDGMNYNDAHERASKIYPYSAEKEVDN